MAPLLPLLTAALALASHSRSEGQSRFVVRDNGQIDVEIELVELDLPELCGVDLSLSQAAARAEEERRLTICVENDFGGWLHLSTLTPTDDTPPARCPVHGLRWRRGEGLAILLDGRAVCDHLDDAAQLRIDWGLFSGASLDHTSRVQVLLPDGTVRRTLFSRRQRRYDVSLPHPPQTAPILVIAAAVIVVAAAGMFGLARRRRRQG